MRERSNALQMASPAAGSERGGRTGDGVGVGVELLQLRGGAVQRRLQLLELGGSRRYSEETLTMTRQDTTWRRFFSFFTHRTDRRFGAQIEEAFRRSLRAERGSRRKKADVVDGESRGRDGTRGGGGGVSINTTNASLKGPPWRGASLIRGS